MTHPLAEDEFLRIYAKVPRLTVEVILPGPGGVYLTRRSTGPCKDRWHIPGGTVRFAEPLEEAVARVALSETGVTVTGTRLAGWIEYPSHYLNGLGWPVGAAFVTGWEGEPQAADGADEGGWFTEPPPGMHGEQAAFLARLAADDPAALTAFRAAA